MMIGGIDHPLASSLSHGEDMLYSKGKFFDFDYTIKKEHKHAWINEKSQAASNQWHNAD